MEVGGIAVDEQDNAYVFNRGEHPVIVFDRDGNVLRSFGEGIYHNRAHGIHYGVDGYIYCVDDARHCVDKFTKDGRMVWTLGEAGKPAPKWSGQPFNRPTHAFVSPKSGDLFVSDGYGNSMVHRYSPDGKLITSWGGIGGSIPLAAVQDALFELTETVVVDITGVTNGVEDGVQQVSVTIVDDDGPPTVTLSSNRTSINENGTLPATVTATLSHGTYQTVTVDLGYGGTATGGVDYTTAITQLTFTPFATTRSVALTGVQDSTYEGAETIVVDITAVTNASESGVQQVTVSITDDDPAPVLGGRNAKLMADALDLTWLGGNVEAGYCIYRINGSSGTLDILPAGPALSPNTTQWEDTTALDDVTYCYAVVPVNAADVLLGMPDILCSMRGLEAGHLKPRDFVVGLNQTDTATLS